MHLPCPRVFVCRLRNAPPDTAVGRCGAGFPSPRLLPCPLAFGEFSGPL
jgi:hypothetical protein